MARAGDVQQAEALYQEGRALLSAGHIDRACQKFAESQAMDPATGTLLNLAACRQRQGKLASAWAAFTKAEAAADHDGRADRVRFAREQRALIEPRLSYVTIHAPFPAAFSLEVRLDDQIVPRDALGKPLPVDPGTHLISADAPRSVPFRRQVEVAGDGARIAVTVAFDPPADGAGVSGTTAGVSGTTAEQGSRRFSVPVVVAAGVGAAGLVAGTVLGLRTFSLADQRTHECTLDECSKRGLELERSARQSAIMADVAFGVALVGLGTAAYLAFFREPSAQETPTAAIRKPTFTALLSRQGGGLAMVASW
jgi:hypothetical protein